MAMSTSINVDNFEIIDQTKCSNKSRNVIFQKVGVAATINFTFCEFTNTNRMCTTCFDINAI